ncbi:hypothetical protein FB451DRAFT_1370993 [Mycena latifolia]|nr:hypothetical protein FB451DRAFT_1370993 [Mycena latifolia]
MSSSSMGNCSGALGVAKNSSNDLLPFNWRLLQREEDDIKRFRNGAETGPVISGMECAKLLHERQARRSRGAWTALIVALCSVASKPGISPLQGPWGGGGRGMKGAMGTDDFCENFALAGKIVDESVECGDLVIQSGHFVYGLDEEGFNLLYFGFGRNMIRVQKEQLEVLHIIKYRLRVNSNTEHIKVVIFSRKSSKPDYN